MILKFEFRVKVEEKIETERMEVKFELVDGVNYDFIYFVFYDEIPQGSC